MIRKKVLITVTTYPLPSRSYDELVCTAGILEDGTWIRIYPVPFKFLSGLRSNGIIGTYKFTWIEINLRRRFEDFRPESHSPINYDFSDITFGDSIEIKGGVNAKQEAWKLRKILCTKAVYKSIRLLIADSKAPKNQSLATFKPEKLLSFEIEDDDREWKDEWKEQLKQLEIFNIDGQKCDNSLRKLIAKIPYKFYYKFRDEEGKISRMMIEDWEIGQLYFNCLKTYKTEEIALEKVREKYWNQFCKRDIHFFLGTTKQWHTRRSKNPFVIIGVFYPPHINESYLPNNQLKIDF